MNDITVNYPGSRGQQASARLVLLWTEVRNIVSAGVFGYAGWVIAKIVSRLAGAGVR